MSYLTHDDASETMTAGRHVLIETDDVTDAEMLEFEMRAAARYRAMAGLDDSLNDRAKRARRNAEQTPLTTKTW